MLIKSSLLTTTKGDLMKRMILFATLVVISLTGCQQIKQEFSAELQEQAVIVSAVHTPSRHESQVGMTAFKSGSIGMDYGGNVGIGIGGGLQISHVTIPEKFAVVFRCQHGEFIVERQGIYDRFRSHERDTVTIHYREVYSTVTDSKNDSTWVVKRTLVDLDFLDAFLKK